VEEYGVVLSEGTVLARARRNWKSIKTSVRKAGLRTKIPKTKQSRIKNSRLRRSVVYMVRPVDVS